MDGRPLVGARPALPDWRDSSETSARGASVGRRAVLRGVGAAGVASLSGCGSRLGASDVRIRAPDAALVDRSLDVVVEGLPPGETVTLTARTYVDTYVGTERWSAAATFAVPDDGRVALAEQAPVEGDYAGVAPMGLFWAMSSATDPTQAFFPHDDHEVTLTASVDGGRVAKATIQRRFAYEGVSRTPLDEDVVGTLYTPPGDGRAPAVVLLSGSAGGEMTAHARLLASRGYAALALEYFGPEPELADAISEVPAEYVQDALGAVLDHDRVGGSQVGLLGTSKGAELALLVGSLDDRVGAVVGLSPSSVVWEGFDEQWDRTGTSSWTRNGDPVPFVEYAPSAAVPDEPGFRALYEYSQRTAPDAQVAAATIRAERVDGPVALVSGGDDRVWHSGPMAQQVLDRLDGRRFDDTHHAVDGAGHWIRPPFLPMYGTTDSVAVALGGDLAANARASRDHWPVVLETLETLETGDVVAEVPAAERSLDASSEDVPVGTLASYSVLALVAIVGGFLALAEGLRWRRSRKGDRVGRRTALDDFLGSDAADRYWIGATVLAGLVFQQLGYDSLMVAAWAVTVLSVLWVAKDYTYERLEAYYDRVEAADDDGPERALTPHSLGRDVKMGFVVTLVWLGILVAVLGVLYLLTGI